jgi:hypothetical protein
MITTSLIAALLSPSPRVRITKAETRDTGLPDAPLGRSGHLTSRRGRGDGKRDSESLESDSATIEIHRAVQSVVEELQAVDWYNQRVDAEDDDLRILRHNRDEEKEHAAMALEWWRRHDLILDRHLVRTCSPRVRSRRPSHARDGASNLMNDRGYG